MFVAVGGLMSLGAGAIFPFYNVFLTTIGASAGQIGLIYAGAGLLAAFIGLYSPWFAQRFGPLQAVVLIRLSPIPLYLLLVAFPVLPLAIFGQVIRTISINMAWPIDSTYASDILPARERSKAFSYRSGAWNLGWSLASFVVGGLIVTYGYNVSFIAYVFFMTVAMTLFYVYFSRADSRVEHVTATVSPLPREERESLASST
jgi:MFS family permease